MKHHYNKHYFIIADDISWNYVGVYMGIQNIKTLYFDKMTLDGMIFNDAFLTTSFCSSYRKSMKKKKC